MVEETKKMGRHKGTPQSQVTKDKIRLAILARWRKQKEQAEPHMERDPVVLAQAEFVHGVLSPLVYGVWRMAYGVWRREACPYSDARPLYDRSGVASIMRWKARALHGWGTHSVSEGTQSVSGVPPALWRDAVEGRGGLPKRSGVLRLRPACFAYAGLRSRLAVPTLLDCVSPIVSQIKIWASRSGLEASAGFMVNESNRLKPLVQKII